MCIPEDSKSSMLNIVVENIRKSYAVSSSAVEKMTDCLKAPGNSCTGGKTTDCLKEDASQGMNDSFTRENQTWNTANTVELEHTDIDVVPDPTSSVPRRVEISQNPEDGITMAGAGVRGNMDTASEKCLEGSCVDSHAGITMAGAGVKENMNTASEHCLEFSCVDSRPSQAKSKTISDEGHTGSLAFGFKARKNEITESEGSNKFHFVDYVVPRSCSKSKDNDGKEEVRRCRPPKKQKGRPLQKQRGRNPENDMINVRVTRSMKRQRKSSLENTSAMPEVVTSAVVLETPRKQSHAVNMQRESFLQNTLATTNEVTAAVVLETPKKKTFLRDTSATTNGVTAAVVSDTPKKKTFLQETSAMTNGVTAAVVLGTPKKQSRALPARCQSPSTSKLSKQQDKTKKVDKSQKMLSTLRRSIRIQNQKCYADLP
ncbi:hypothetical protein Leryth_001156 [Lithospermum erythrorhizon]|nr:hypothetical protein Leryth_001156 [Lithospermum erythrorhizon]